MKPHETVLYDTTNHTERYDEARDFLFATRADEFDWKTDNDVPEKMIYDEMSFMQSLDYQYFQDKLNELIAKNTCIIMGTCGRWSGRVSCGRFIENFNEFIAFVEHLDEIKIVDKGGRLIISGYHHDGHDEYELKVLTKKGLECAKRNAFEHSKTFHERIMNNSTYSKLPRLESL